MSEAAQWIELAKTLGTAGPLVFILFWLLRQANEERQAITTSFLNTLSETVRANAESSARLGAALSELIGTVRESAAQQARDHQHMLELLTRRNEVKS